MKNIRLICSLFLVVTLGAGCASAPPPPSDPALMNLEVPTRQTSTVLPKHISEFHKGDFWKLADRTHTLLGGKYIASKENALGTFYVAEHYAFANQYNNNRTPHNLQRGGFWVPKGGDFKPRFFLITPSRPMQVDDLASLEPASVEQRARAPGPLLVQTASATGAMQLGIAGGVVGAILEHEYSQPPREVLLGPVTNPEMLQALAAAVAQLQPVPATVQPQVN